MTENQYSVEIRVLTEKKTCGVPSRLFFCLAKQNHVWNRRLVLQRPRSIRGEVRPNSPPRSRHFLFVDPGRRRPPLSSPGHQWYSTRLSNQPFTVGEWCVVCNGEIYNARILAERFPCASKSDCEVIPQMFAAGEDAKAVCSQLDGVFAFVAVHTDPRSRPSWQGIRSVFAPCTWDGPTECSG